MRALLDVNMLIALMDQAHEHHNLASDWLSRNIGGGWASCPITQNGCIRIMSQRNYQPEPFAIKDIMDLLEYEVSQQHHEFIVDDISLIHPSIIDRKKLSNPGQLTDCYLLALAVKHQCRLVTLDRKIIDSAVKNFSQDHLLILNG